MNFKSSTPNLHKIIAVNVMDTAIKLTSPEIKLSIK